MSCHALSSTRNKPTIEVSHKSVKKEDKECKKCAKKINDEWRRVSLDFEENISDGQGNSVGKVNLKQSLARAERVLERRKEKLTEFNNANFKILVVTSKGGKFYEFEMVDKDGNPVLVDGKPNQFRIVLEVDDSFKSQVGWLTSDYSVARKKKSCWRVISFYGPYKQIIRDDYIENSKYSQ